MIPTRRSVLAGTAALLAMPAVRARAATVMKVSTSFPNDPKFSTARIWYDLFLPRLKDATNNEVTTQFFPDNQLGQEADVVNQVKMGVVDMALMGTPIWANIVPEFGVFDLGYIFNDYDHMRRAADSPAGRGLAELLVQKAGAHMPSVSRNLGARNFITKFAFKEPAELTGKKIRSLPSPVVTEVVRLMGAAATPMAFGEIYTGLQAGVIDGLEHDAPTALSSKFYEVAKQFTYTRHIHNPYCAFISDRTVKRLPPAQRDGVIKAMNDATDAHFLKAAQVEAEAVEELKSKGVVFAECDRSVFRDRVSPMWDRFAEKTPGAKAMLAAIRDTAKG